MPTRSQAWTVILGSSVGVQRLTRASAGVAGDPNTLGCLVRDYRGQHSIGGLPVLGRVDDLVAVQRAIGFERAVLAFEPEEAEGEASARALCVEAGLSTGGLLPAERGQAVVANPTGGVAGPHGAPMAGSRLDLSALIGREPHQPDDASVRGLIAGRRVLITGAGGSIGSELARIVAGYRPDLLVLMERSENALFEIDRQCGRLFPRVERRAVLHDVVDERATRERFASLRPDVVFHAAAHKHVPLMEDHASHAVSNNVFGTASVFDAAAEAGASWFVLVSTDKAVRPSSVMGATKRLAELYVRHRSRAAALPACAVRFGNVLGSAGSVLPIWSAQLAEGGPITVTDARMTRYFMTIREAATLVVQAGSMIDRSGPGQVFVLDMGDPVRVLELAERFVALHGFEARVIPAGDTGALGGWIGRPGAKPIIDVALTGTRPGEKLHEALAYDAETLAGTGHAGIRVLRSGGEAEVFDPSAMLSDLGAVRHTMAREPVIEALGKWVPELAETRASTAAA